MRLLPPLTVLQVKQAVQATSQDGQRRELRDGVVRGLTLRTGALGARWSLQIAVAGVQRRFALGVYPHMSLADARKVAQDKRNDIARYYGSRIVPDAPRTLLELLNAYEPHAVTLKSWQSNEAQKRIKSVLAPLLDYPLIKLDARMIQRAVDAHTTVSTAANAVRYVRPVLKWGRRRGYCAVVAEDIEQPRGAHKERDRVLSEQELKSLLQALTFQGYDLAARLLLLTAVRLNELRGLHQNEIDLANKLWTIPANRMKAGQPHIVPLSDQATTLLNLALQVSPTPFAHLSNWDRWQKKIFLQTNTQNWHRHDLRRTSATIMGERLEIEPHIVDAALAHAHLTGNKVARTYNRARYTPQIAVALQKLADFYASLCPQA